MKDAGLVLKEQPHTLRVPRSQRGGEARLVLAARCTCSGSSHTRASQVIEPLVSEQWFVKMETLAAPGTAHLLRAMQTCSHF